MLYVYTLSCYDSSAHGQGQAIIAVTVISPVCESEKCRNSLILLSSKQLLELQKKLHSAVPAYIENYRWHCDAQMS